MNGSSGRRRVSSAAVATDDERIFAAVQAFGGRAVMTSPRHRSGTDRIAEAVETLGLEDDDIVVNIQGDQPLFEPVQVDEVVGPLLADASIPMSTLIYRIVRDEEITHPNAVKVVFDRDHFALYFSRATIPFVRDRGQTGRLLTSTTGSTPTGGSSSCRSAWGCSSSARCTPRSSPRPEPSSWSCARSWASAVRW